MEVVMSLAILSMSLLWVLKGQSDSVTRNIRARMLSQGMRLAQSKLLETETTMRREGFGFFEDQQCGDFQGEYEGAERFRFCVTIEKIELPDITMLQEKIMGGSLGAGNEESGSPFSNILSQYMPGGGSSSEVSEGFGRMASSFMGQAMSMIQTVLENAVRRVTVRVMWKVAKKERHFEIVSYFTDLDELDRSLLGGAMGGSSSGSTSGTSGSGNSGITGAKIGGSTKRGSSR